MNDLRVLREQVRIFLDEQNANLFSDAEIDKNLNEGAKLAARSSQCLRYPFQKTVEADKAEYGLIAGTTDVISVKYFDGSLLYNLKLIDPTVASFGSRTTTTRPTHYYLKPWTPYFEYQGSDNNLSLLEINSRDKNDWQSVLGIYPIPSTAGHIVTVDAYISHPTMRKDNDVCLIPEEFDSIPIYYATFKGLLKAKYYAEATVYKDLFTDMLSALSDFVAQASSVSHPMVKMAGEEDVNCNFSETWVD